MKLTDDASLTLAFLQALDLEDYFENLVRNGYDRMDTLYCATMEDLQGIDIKQGHARLLLDNAKLHKQEDLRRLFVSDDAPIYEQFYAVAVFCLIVSTY